ncbi:MAG: tRNA threonylcarbamoyladenosine dehydratase [Oscillospiraceae bacterium]|jgi:tRNA A37 threonylcarbamoyladenosine dehydratase|nr:tRNA threonylcarbamoyladenosine dehydratase [Oscillospiraceae bacterium]
MSVSNKNNVNQFTRTAMLLGLDSIATLSNLRVAVFGIGGVGGHATDALCRCGIGAIDIFDGDVIDVTNINRQLIATHSTIGQNKVDVMQKHLLDINPNVSVKALKIFYLPETADEIDLSVYDYIIDAVDTITAKLELVSRASKINVPIISSMGAANKLNPTAFEVADIFNTSVCPIAKVMRHELKKRDIKKLKVVYSKEKPKTPIIPHKENESSCENNTHTSRTRPPVSSVSFVPPVVGLIIAGEVVKDLLGIVR